MAATAATEQQDDLFDARFEFDAPRYYDFQAMSPGSPADKWFDTAPDGPGCKPESEGLHQTPQHPGPDREDVLNPLSCALLQSPPATGSHSSSCKTMPATRHRCARRRRRIACCSQHLSVLSPAGRRNADCVCMPCPRRQQGQQAAAAAAGAGAAGNADKPRAQEQQPKKVNIVTSWGQAAAAAAAGAGAGAASGTGGGNKAAARPARKSVPVGRKPSVPAMAAGRKSVPVGRKGPAAAAAAAAAAEQREHVCLARGLTALAPLAS